MVNVHCLTQDRRGPAESDRLSDYGWPTIPPSLGDLPIALVDLDGTLRGDVVPMVKLARPMVPNYLGKICFHEPLNGYKCLGFAWNLARLWTLRTLNHEHRRRYKHLFSELHHLAAALLQDTRLDVVRRRYGEQVRQFRGLWHPGAVELLRRVTRSSVVVLVTGSEQMQTEECVRLLSEHGVDTGRIFVHGSLYGYDASMRRFTGEVEQLNVTLDGKRDAVRAYVQDPARRIIGAIGNSRPDRALFEAVEQDGLCVLVCAASVLRKRKETTFVVRKLRRSGYQIHWDVTEFFRAVSRYAVTGAELPRPILATDSSFDNVLSSTLVERAFRHVGRVRVRIA